MISKLWHFSIHILFWFPLEFFFNLSANFQLGIKVEYISQKFSIMQKSLLKDNKIAPCKQYVIFADVIE